ncbi:MAG: SIMPL domain-containing protein [Planctomycetota bacterium]
MPERPEPGTIEVHETAETRLVASGATLEIMIGGQAFFSGDEPFKKAEEVRRCVDGLVACGVSEDEISIADVDLSVSSGKLAKASTASYRLSVRLADLSRLGPALAAVASLKQAHVSRVVWTHEGVDGVRGDLLERAARSARVTGDRVAAAIGTRCVGVKDLRATVTTFGGGSTDLDRLAVPTAMRAKRPADLAFSGDSGGAGSLSLGHSTTLRIDVAATFLVSPFGSD